MNPTKKSGILLARLHYNKGVFPSKQYFAYFRATPGFARPGEAATSFAGMTGQSSNCQSAVFLKALSIKNIPLFKYFFDKEILYGKSLLNLFFSINKW